MSEQHTLTGEHGHWETGIEGLRLRHVKRIHIEWEDKPPSDIAEQRLRDITAAMRLGFEKLDRPIDEDAVRARLGTKVSGVAEGQMEDGR